MDMLNMGISGTMIDIPKGDRLLMAASSQRETVRVESATALALESDDPQSQCSVYEEPQPDDPDIAAHHSHMSDHGSIACLAGTLIDHLYVGEREGFKPEAHRDTTSNQYGKDQDFEGYPTRQPQ